MTKHAFDVLSPENIICYDEAQRLACVSLGDFVSSCSLAVDENYLK